MPLRRLSIYYRQEDDYKSHPLYLIRSCIESGISRLEKQNKPEFTYVNEDL